MPNTLVMRKCGPRADAILDAFGRETGLAARDGDEARIFSVEGAGHAIDVCGSLDPIDPGWGDHVELVTEVS
jgi:hypothetical protein